MRGLVGQGTGVKRADPWGKLGGPGLVQCSLSLTEGGGAAVGVALGGIAARL